MLERELLLWIIIFLCANQRSEFGLGLESFQRIVCVLIQDFNLCIHSYDSFKKCLSCQSSVNNEAHLICNLDREESILLLTWSWIERSKALEDFKIFDLGLKELVFSWLFHCHRWFSFVFAWLLYLFRTKSAKGLAPKRCAEHRRCRSSCCKWVLELDWRRVWFLSTFLLRRATILVLWVSWNIKEWL